MALIEEQLRTKPEPSALTRPAPPGEDERISKRSSLTLIVAWAVLFPVALSLEPAPAADATQPWWAYVASMGLLGALAATFVGLGRRARWGITASLGASSIFAAGVFACPATGHHAFGLWWIGEFAASLALLGLSAVAYFRTFASR